MSCRACGNSNVWCSVYTGCPLNKGKEHMLTPERSYNPFLTNFADVEDIVREYGGSAAADLAGAEVLLAWYGYGSYCGSSFVLYEKDGKLYEVNGSHCSCMGLEGQWEPEETSWAALAMRQFYADECDGSGEMKELVEKLAKEKNV